MNIKNFHPIPGIEANQKLQTAYTQFDSLLVELRKRELPEAMVQAINAEIDKINALSGTEAECLKQIKKSQAQLLKLLEKELKLVVKNHYRNTWLALGMTIFGVPLGVVFGISLGNLAYLGIGLPIGMAIGISVGTGMDKKAAEEGRQLNVEMK